MAGGGQTGVAPAASSRPGECQAPRRLRLMPCHRCTAPRARPCSPAASCARAAGGPLASPHMRPSARLRARSPLTRHTAHTLHGPRHHWCLTLPPRPTLAPPSRGRTLHRPRATSREPSWPSQPHYPARPEPQPDGNRRTEPKRSCPAVQVAEQCKRSEPLRTGLASPSGQSRPAIELTFKRQRTTTP